MSTGLKANSDGSAAIQVGGTDVITLTSGGAATFVTSPTTVQAGTAAAPSITFSGDTNTGIYSPGADTVGITAGGTLVGSVGLGTTLALQGATSQSGTGITFPATQSASTNANTLDDYEEGTWTPVVRGSGTAGTYQTGGGTGGWYTKIGKCVTIICNIELTSITGGGTGYLQITGIPFSNATGIGSQGAVQMAGLDMTTNTTWLTAMPITSPTTTWYLSESGDNQAGSDFPISGVSSNDVIRFTATFFTT